MQRVLWGRFGFQNLLFWLFVYLVVSPFLTTLPHSRYIFQFVLTLVLLFAVFAVHRNKGIMTLAVTLMALTLAFHWMGELGFFHYSGQVSHLIMVLYLATLVYSFFRVIFSAKQVTSSLICATLCLYLIIGLLWGSLFALLEAMAPGSFSGGVLDHASSMVDRLRSFVYFSFITLTTLGYGDITPQTQGAGALCQAEAIVGQFYIAVLVARFVSMYGSEMNRGNSESP